MFDTQTLAFTGVALLLTLTPGADTLLVVRSVLARGRRAGGLTMLGILSGLFVHATFSGLGLSLVLVRSAAAFEIVKYAGTAYLIFLGGQSLWEAWRGGSAALAVRAPVQAGRRAFLEGLFNNLLNPKVAVFYLAFLPQFIGPEDPFLAKALLLAGIHFVQGLAWLSLVIVFIGRARAVLTTPRVRRGLEALTGLVLVGLGVRLALEKR